MIILCFSLESSAVKLRDAIERILLHCVEDAHIQNGLDMLGLIGDEDNMLSYGEAEGILADYKQKQDWYGGLSDPQKEKLEEEISEAKVNKAIGRIRKQKFGPLAELLDKKTPNQKRNSRNHRYGAHKKTSLLRTKTKRPELT